MYVCLCRGVTSQAVVGTVSRGARTTRQVALACGAGADCGRCRRTIRTIIEAQDEAHGVAHQHFTAESTAGFILLHGGEHGSRCWDRVTARLRWPAVAVDLPGRGAKAGDHVETGLIDNAAALVDAINHSGIKPYILVCHSPGGLTVLAAEPRHVTPPAHRVFVSALAPAPGDTGLDALPVIFRWFLRLRLRRPIAAHRAVHLIPKWLAIRIWCHGLDPADRRLILSRLCAESAQIPAEPTPPNFGGAQRSTYIVLERDRAISPRLQRAMAAGLGIADVRRVDAGHEAMFGHPDDLAGELNALAANVFDQEGSP
jgi:bacterioferritin-associated ferredoxin